MSDRRIKSQILNELYQVIKARKEEKVENSYTCKLFEQGIDEICKKFGEEAVEVVIAALNQKKQNVVKESGDALFHLLVLWAELGIEPQEIMDELRGRFGLSGIEEKQRRLIEK